MTGRAHSTLSVTWRARHNDVCADGVCHPNSAAVTLPTHVGRIPAAWTRWRSSHSDSSNDARSLEGRTHGRTAARVRRRAACTHRVSWAARGVVAGSWAIRLTGVVDADDAFLGVVIKHDASGNLPAFYGRPVKRVNVERICFGDAEMKEDPRPNSQTPPSTVPPHTAWRPSPSRPRHPSRKTRA